MAPRAAVVVMALALLAGPVAGQTPDRQQLRQELRRAEALERAGRLTDAEALLRSVIDQWPGEAGAILGLERVLRREGELEELLPVVERAIALDPDAVLLRQVQLRTLADLGRIDELRRAGAEWLNASPELGVAYRDFASSLRRLGQAAEAERVLKEGLPRASRPSALVVELADLYLSQGRWYEAAEQWLEIMNVSAGVGWDLISYKLESLADNARPAAEATLQLLARSDAPGAPKLAALAALYADRPDEARLYAQRVLDSELPLPERRAFINQVARAAAAREEEELAAWAYRYLLAAEGGRASRLDLAQRLVEHELARGDTAAALEALDRGLEDSEPGSAEHRWGLSRRVRLLANRDEARAAEVAWRRWTESYASETEETAALAAAVAAADLRAGRLDEAREIVAAAPRSGLDRATAAQLDIVGAYVALHDGDYDAARSRLEGAALAVPGTESNEAIRLLGILREGGDAELDAVAAAHRMLSRGRPGDAFDRLSRAMQRSPASPARPALLLWAGELALAAGDLAAAEEVLLEVERSFPGTGEAPVALMTLAEALAEDGRGAEAVEHLERLILGYPDSALTPIARRRLAELREEVPSL